MLTPDERLAELARFLREEVPQYRFDLTTWARNFDGQPMDPTRLLEPGCGTVCCAVGWAAANPVLRADGLRLRPDHAIPWQAIPEWGDLDSWPAVEEFFGLNDRQAVRLFDHESYGDWPSPVEVAERIEYFLETGKA